MNQLIIPNETSVKGLYVFCNKCKLKSKSQLTPDARCGHPYEKQVFKVIITVQGLKTVKTKSLTTRDVNKAIEECRVFEKTLKDNDYQNIEIQDNNNFTPTGLMKCGDMYIAYLRNLNVYEHQKKIRTSSHIKQVKSNMKKFVLSLKSKGINENGVLIRHLNNHHVEIFHNYLMKQNKMSNRTYNCCMNSMSNFFTYLIKIKQYDLVNYFSSTNVKRKPINSKIDSLPIVEYKALFDLVEPKNGTEVLLGKKKKVKNHYHDWLKDSFELAILTGRRRDELVNMKFIDIKEEHGKPSYIESEDYKFNLKNNLFDKEHKQINRSPIIPELMEFLVRIGYNEYKGTSRYLIAPNSSHTRSTIKDDMSKGFTHYYKQLKTGKNLSFRHMRKTYLTLINNFTLGSAEIISGHHSKNTVQKYYQDKKVISKVYKDFRLDELESSDN